MEKKKKQKVIGISCAVLLLGLILGWWIASRTTYINIIPKEAKCVVKIDLKQLSAAAGNPTNAKERLEKALGMKLSGIDLSQPLYVFITPNEYFAVVGAVSNADSIKMAAQAWPDKWALDHTDEDEDASWGALKNGWQLAWNKSSVLLLGPGTVQERSEMRQTMRQLIEEDADESYPETPKWKKLNNLRGHINMISSIDALPTPYNLFMELALPNRIPSEKVDVCSEIKFDNTGINIDNRITSDDDGVTKLLADRSLQPAMLKGIFTSAVDKNDVAWLTMTAKGNDLLEMLHNDQTVRALLAALDQGIDADMMTRSIDGELSLRIPSLTKDGTPAYALTAQLANKKFENDIDYWKSSLKGKKDMSLVNSGKGYLFSYKDKALYFGTEALNLYACSSQSLAVNAFGKTNNVPTTNLQGCYLYFWINVPSLLHQPAFGKDGKAGEGLIKTMLGNGKEVVFRAESLQHSAMKITSSDGQNPLKRFLK